MHRLSAGMAMICLMTAVTVGCGEVSASHPGSASSGSASSGSASAAAASPGCPGSVSAGPAGETLTITLVGNDKTYCVRVGDKLLLSLRSTEVDPWQAPRMSGSALTPVSGAVPAPANGITGASYVAVRPGEAGVTSVRPPCHTSLPPPGKGGLQPGVASELYPIRDCPRGYLFTASIIVVR